MLALAALVVAAWAQPPASSDSRVAYKVRLRFKIDADLQQRYALYKEMLARLQAAGFTAEAGRPGEELYGDQLAGTLPASGLPVLRLERFVRTAVLVPTTMQLPTEADKTVLVRLELSHALGNERQRELASQARSSLKPLGFIENEGHDHHGYTRLLGRLPVAALDALLKDSAEVSLTVSQVSGARSIKVALVRLALVIPEPAAVVADVGLPSGAPAGKEYLDKLSPDLRAYIAKVPEADLEKYFRVELVLRGHQFTRQMQLDLNASEARFIAEGSCGPFVSGLVAPSRIAALASEAAISTIRLPQAARPFAAPSQADVGMFVEFVPLAQDGGRTVSTGAYRKPPATRKAVIIGDDFRGYERLVGKSLPKKTELVDVTREQRLDQTPAPLPEGNGVGQSAQLAAAFLRDHPADEVKLVRINPATPYQVAQTGEAVQGMRWQTPALTARHIDLKMEEDRLEADRTDVRVIRRQVLREFGLDENSVAKRQAYRKRQEELEAAEKVYETHLERFRQFEVGTQSLKGANEVCIALQWADGYTDVGGSAPTLRCLPKDVFAGVSWFQAVARRPGQVWSGHFRDQDADGVMEFTQAPGDARPDLAFLAWKAFGVGAPQSSLPEGAVIQVTLNWTEAHEPTFSKEMTDYFRKPLASFGLKLLKQRDPTGKQLPLDAFEVVARTPSLADRVENNSRYSQYQLTLRYVVPAGGGRYAVQVVGLAPSSTFPVGVTPLTPERPEIRPKLVVEVVDPLKRNQGRVVLERFATSE